MGNLKQTDLQRLKTEERKPEYKTRKEEPQETAPGNSQKLKRGDDNELKRSLRLEKPVASKQFRLTVQTKKERRARLENDAATKRLRLAVKMDEEE